MAIFQSYKLKDEPINKKNIWRIESEEIVSWSFFSIPKVTKSVCLLCVRKL